MERKLILRPLNRVKMMIWPKLKLGWIDIGVFFVSFAIFVTIGFVAFDKPLISAGFAFGVGTAVSSLLITGQPQRRTYNYIIIFISWMGAKKKYTGDHVSRINPYSALQGDTFTTKTGSKGMVFRILGNDIGQNLSNVIENKLEAYADLFQGQSLTYQIIKQDRKANTVKHLMHLNNPSNRGTKILEENKNILGKINDEGQFYSHYFIEFSSSRKNRLQAESTQIESILAECGLDTIKLENFVLGSYLIKKLIPSFDIKQLNKEDFKEGKVTDFKEVWFNALGKDTVKFTSTAVRVGDHFQKTMAIDKFPLYSNLSFLAGIYNMENTQVVMQSRSINTAEAIKMINRAFNEIIQRINGKGGKLSDNKEQQIYLDSMEELMEDIQGSGEELKAINCYITIFGTTRAKLAKLERNIYKEVKRTRMNIDKLFMKQLDIFMNMPASIAGSIEGRNQIEVGTTALSQTWPFVAQSFNDVSGDYIGRALGGKPCFLDWRLRDEGLNRHQSNSIIFGSTGGGKTTFTKKILKDEWSRGVNCYIMDPEGEYERLAKNIGGVTIDLSGVENKDGVIERMNPLQVFVGEKGSSSDWLGSHFKFLNDFFSQLLYPSLKDTVIQMNYLKYAIQKLYKAKNINNENVMEVKNENFPIISDLHAQLLKLAKNTGTKDFTKKEIFQELSERLYDLTKLGTDGKLWDGKTTLDIRNKTFVSFNFKNLINGGNQRLVGAQSYLTYKYILHVVFLNKDKAEREGKIQNVSITIDEAHKFINPDNPTGVLFAFSMYKQIRKYHGWIRMTTQNIGDFTADPTIKKETSGIINNSQFMFIFKLKPKDIEDLDDLIKTTGGLTSREKGFLSKEVSHQYLFFSGNYRTQIRVDYTLKEKEIMGWINHKETDTSTREIDINELQTTTKL